MNMDFSWLPTYGHLFVIGLFYTILMVIVSGAIGFGLAILVGIARVSGGPVINTLCKGFISVIRGTPLLVQMFILYNGIGALFASIPALRNSFVWFYVRDIDVFWYVILALSISVGAYGGEIIRGAMLAVPKGEIEAARAYGFSGWRLMRRIWLPRAIQPIIPTIAGETVLLLKSTALASVIAFSLSRLDLFGAASVVRARTYLTYEPLLLVAVGYFCLTMLIEAVFRRLEAHYAKAYQR
jgi:polar amino acid transport system permease protein